jgi:tetratricopeptide (TPR) repeat protein
VSQLESRSIRSFATVRASALFYPALAAPVVLLLFATGLWRADRELLFAAGVLLVASLAAGVMSAALAAVSEPLQGDVVLALLRWVATLALPIAIVSALTIWLAPKWPALAALGETFTLGSVLFVAIPSAILSMLLLTAPIRGDVAKPVVLRHRHGILSDRTVFALAGLVFVAALARKATVEDRFARGDEADVRAQLPRLANDAALYPNHFRTQYRYANALIHLREYGTALPVLQRAVALDPNDGWAENDLGFALNGQRRYAEALAPLRVSVLVMPNESRPRFNLGWALEQTHDWAGAQAEYHQILERWPNDIVAMAREAVARYNHGEREEGLSEVRRALATGDTSYWVKFSAAEIFSNSALLADAAKEYGELARGQPTNVWLWAQYGSAAYLADMLPEARTAFDHAYSLAPQAFQTVPPWGAMRDAAGKGIHPSQLPPIPPYTGRPIQTIELGPTRR